MAVKPGFAILRKPKGTPYVKVPLEAVEVEGRGFVVPGRVGDDPVWNWGTDEATIDMLLAMINERLYPTPPPGPPPP